MEEPFLYCSKRNIAITRIVTLLTKKRNIPIIPFMAIETRPAIPAKVASRREMTELLKHTLYNARYDPVLELVEIAQDPATDVSMRVDIAMCLTGFVYPKLKSVDLEHSTEGGLAIQLIKFTDAPPQKKGEPQKTIDITPKGQKALGQSVPEPEPLGQGGIPNMPIEDDLGET